MIPNSVAPTTTLLMNLRTMPKHPPKNLIYIYIYIYMYIYVYTLYI